MTGPTALIAEDEPLLAAALRAELARAWPELQLLATVGDGQAAVAQALALQPDVLFLDIRMPGQSGLDAAGELADAWSADGPRPFPALVFVTAYDSYAVQAFDAQAVDYLLKPVQSARLRQTVQRLQALLASRAPATTTPQALDQTAQRLRELLDTLQPAPPASAGTEALRWLQASLPGSGGDAIRLVPLEDVIYLQAADKYLRVLTAQAEYLLRTPLKELLPRLDAATFWQIHRGTVVRASAIDTVSRDTAGRHSLSLHGRPDRLAVSRLYSQRFKAQ